MEKKSIQLKSSVKNLFLVLLFFSSCNKDLEFIEVTKGLTMNRSESRIGIKITSTNDLYYCKEIISKGRRTSKYKYYKYNGKIDFKNYRKKILNNFKIQILPKYLKVSDANYYQLYYNLSSKQYKSIFIESDLDLLQGDVLFDLINLPDKKIESFKEISFYDFSDELLKEKLPTPPKLE